MENQTTPTGPVIESTRKSPLFTVTRVSKYLALLLFIALPFIGGMVGYNFALQQDEEVAPVIVNRVQQTATSDTMKLWGGNFDMDGYVYLPAFVPETVSVSSDLFDVTAFLEKSPLKFETNFPMEDLELLAYPSNPEPTSTDSPCNQSAEACDSILLRGHIYEVSVLASGATGDATDVGVDELLQTLRAQGWRNLYGVEKGFQFGEVYEKRVGNRVQLVKVSVYPINLSFDENGNNATSDGSSIQVYVSKTFVNPEEGM